MVYKMHRSMASVFTRWTLIVLTLMAHTTEHSPTTQLTDQQLQSGISRTSINSTNQQDSIAITDPTDQQLQSGIRRTSINSTNEEDSIAITFPTDQQLQNGIKKLFEKNKKSAEIELYSAFVTETTVALKDALEIAKNFKTIKALTEGVFQSIPLVAQTIGAILSILSFHLFPSTEEIIQEEFEQVNKKLDAITAEIRNMREDIRLNTEFHAWMSTYIDWELTIRNGEEKLNTMMSQMRAANDERTKLKIAKAFTDYYIHQDVDGAMKKIFYLSTNTDSVTVSNIFQLYAKETKCDIKGLAMLMITILDLTISASRQMYIHAFLVYNTPAIVDQQVQTIYDQLYQTRKEYQELVLSCYENTIKTAKNEIEDILTIRPQDKGQQLTGYIQSKLIQMFPWYDWAVIQYEEAFTVGDSICISLEPRGHQAFTVMKDDRNILVMWLDPKDTTNGCTADNIINARNFIPLTLCDDCENTLQAGDTFFNSSSCSAFLDSLVMRAASGCENLKQLKTENINTYVKYKRLFNDLFKNGRFTTFNTEEIPLNKVVDISYIAGGFKSIRKPCAGKDCSGHGQCRAIPDTSNYICICEPYFDGLDCENSVDPSYLLHVAKIMDKMRANFGKFIGVPDIVDVYLELRELPKQLKTMKDSIMSSIEYRGILNQYGQNLAHAEYIAEKYIALLSQGISEQQFIHEIQKLQKLNFDFNLFFWSLKKIVHGDGILTQEDLLYHYKKSQVEAQPCTSEYNVSVQGFMQNILTLDQIVSEAQVRFLYWSLDQRRASRNNTEERAHIADIAEAATKRQEGYQQYWKKSSCPKLSNDIDLLEKHCDDSSSYQGQTVILHCLNKKRLIPVETITCVRVNDVLEWSAKPSCIAKNVGEWGSWSTCSQTCGQGTRTRRRTIVYTSQEYDPSTGLTLDSSNQEEETDTGECNIKDCCQAEFGKFRCSNGKCINQDYVCDGDNDCGNNDDESRTRCNYVRSGDSIALKDKCNHKFLSGYGDYPYPDAFQFRDCNCNYERMEAIFARGRAQGEAIRYGDTVAIKFRTIPRITLWVGTYTNYFANNYCYHSDMGSCHSDILFNIFSLARKGKCDGNVLSGCIGKPIQWHDLVFLRHKNTQTYLSGHTSWAVQLTCPGSTITYSDTGCTCESLEIYNR